MRASKKRLVRLKHNWPNERNNGLPICAVSARFSAGVRGDVNGELSTGQRLKRHYRGARMVVALVAYP